MSTGRKQVLGYGLLSLSTLAWGAGIALPFVQSTDAQTLGMAAGLIIAGELLFLASVFFLGKTFYQRLKSQFAKK